MKKATGIISIIGCSLIIILCCYLIIPIQYSEYKQYMEAQKKIELEQSLKQVLSEEIERSDSVEAEETMLPSYMRPLKKIGDFRPYIKSALMDLFLTIGTLVLAALGIYYVIATKFGKPARTVLDNLEKEIDFIKKQIERKELLAKLKNIENSKA